MLLSDAERESLFAQLSAHAGAGRLDVSELERRVAIVDAAQSWQDAVAAFTGLPDPSRTPVASAPDPRTPARARGRRGHAEAERPGPDWTATPERFRDPRTQRIMRVWVDGAGDRHYVAEES